MVFLESVKDLVLRRHFLSMIKYLRDKERDKAVHVTDFVYDCPRYARWIYDARMAGELEDRNLNERDLTVFTIGKKLDELQVGDFHHVKLRMNIDGVDIVGEIDDLIIDHHGKRIIVVDKKHTRQRPPKEAHSHYINQVNMYCLMLVHEKANFVDGEEIAEVVEKALERGYRFWGAVLYIDVSLETRVISDVVEWEINEEALDDLSFKLEKMVEEFKKSLPEPVSSWFCGYCPFFMRCVEAGRGS